jgi:hypothetical protein
MSGNDVGWAGWFSGPRSDAQASASASRACAIMSFAFQRSTPNGAASK